MDRRRTDRRSDERRRHERRPPGPNVVFLCAAEGATVTPESNLARELVNVSPQGACIVPTTRLAVGVSLQISYLYPGAAEPHKTRAIVRWSMDADGAGKPRRLVGLEFDKPVTEAGGIDQARVFQILQVLRVSVAQLRLYPKESPQVLKVVTETYHAIHGFLEGAEALTFTRTPRGLLVNGVPLRASGSAAEALEQSILNLLADVKIKNITYKKGLTVEELVTFLHALSGQFWEIKEGKEINKRLRSERVFRISVDEVQYVALGQGDIVIEDAARKLEAGGTDLNRIIRSLDEVIDSTAGGSLTSEARLHVMKRLLEKDPTLLEQYQKRADPAGDDGGAGAGEPEPDELIELKEVTSDAVTEDVGRLEFDRARDMIGELCRLLPKCPNELRQPLKDLGLAIAHGFEHNIPLSAALRTMLNETAEEVEHLANEEASKQEEEGSEAEKRAHAIRNLPEDLRLKVLQEEGAKLIPELAAMERGDLIRDLLKPAFKILGTGIGRQRLQAARMLASLRRVIDANAPADLVNELEQYVHASLEKEREQNVYESLAEIASFLADRRLRLEELPEAHVTLEYLRKHHRVKDPAMPRRGELAYAALERVTSGAGFASLTKAIRAGSKPALEILGAVEAAATRFLIREIKSTELIADRLRLAQYIARSGAGAGTVLSEELQKSSSIQDTLRLVEVVPHAMPADMAEMALNTSLRNPASVIRRRVSELMVEMNYPRAAPALLEAAHAEKDTELRCAMIEALGRLRFRNALDLLFSLVEDKRAPEKVRIAACSAMGAIGDRKVVPTLIRLGVRGGGGITKMFRTLPSAVRAAAVNALSRFPDDREAVEALKKARGDKDAGVRHHAGRAHEAPLQESFPDVADGARPVADAKDVVKTGGKAGGDLAEIKPTALLEILGRDEATGCLHFKGKGVNGKIYFDSGVVIAADSSGGMDKAAIAVFFQLKGGFFLFVPDEAPGERRVLLPVDSLLAEYLG